MRLATWRLFLAGSDGPGRRALPLGEFMHPVPLLALAVLATNDHVLKGANILPGLVTGKLSDFAGVLFFPLLLTAFVDVLLYGLFRLGVLVDFTLSRKKLWLAIIFTALIFSALQLLPAAAAIAEVGLERIGLRSEITPDPFDLIALVMLVPAYLLGLAEIRRIPLGRLEFIERRRLGGEAQIARLLADVRSLHADEKCVDAVADLVGRGDRPVELARALAELRGERP